jgi:hypothetical protein
MLYPDDCTPRISICVCTFRRPGLLKQLLCDLGKLETVGITHEVEIIVADNDPANSAKPVLESWQATAPFSLTTLHVPVANISLPGMPPLLQQLANGSRSSMMMKHLNQIGCCD